MKWADGDYTLSVTAKDASGNTVAISTEVKGTVDSVDLTQNPPMLKIGGQSFALDKIKQIVRPGPLSRRFSRVLRPAVLPRLGRNLFPIYRRRLAKF